MVESDHHLEQEVQVATGHVLVQMHVMGWTKSPKRGHSTECSIRLAEGPEEERFKSFSGRTCLQQGRPNDLMRALYLHSMPKGETKDLLLFVVPKAHCVTTLNGCHRDAGH